MIPIKKSLNAAFLKQKPQRNDIDKFKDNLSAMLNSINESESEENQKNFIRDFLKKSHFEPNYHINTKGRADLKDKILEAKKANPQADTSEWESEIDKLVYKLYELTDDEIRIVEGE